MKLSNHRRKENGFFLVAALLTVASIMLIYIAINGSRLRTLKREIKLLEQRQIERLNRSHNVILSTNATFIPVSTK